MLNRHAHIPSLDFAFQEANIVGELVQLLQAGLLCALVGDLLQRMREGRGGEGCLDTREMVERKGFEER